MYILYYIVCCYVCPLSVGTLKLHQKNSYLNEGQLFIDRFKVGSLPRMINIVLAQFIDKTT